MNIGTVTFFSLLPKSNNFAIQKLYSKKDLRTSPTPTYIVYVYIDTYGHYFQSSTERRQLCHRKVAQKRRFPDPTHTHVHCIGVYSHVRSLFLVYYRIQTTLLHKSRMETMISVYSQYITHAHEHCMSCNGKLPYESKIKPAYSMRLAETRILVYRTLLYVLSFSRSNVKTKKSYDEDDDDEGLLRKKAKLIN